MSENIRKIQVIILAAGQGKRMGGDIPKVLVPFKGRPMIDYVLDAVYASNAKEITPIVVVGYQQDRVRNYIGNRALFAFQEQQLGTGHAVLCTKHLIGADIDDILILYGDQPTITCTMINDLIARHTTGKQLMTLATCTVPSFDDWYQVFYSSFSRIVRDDTGIIIKSVEFKDASDEEKKIHELNPCYFICDRVWAYDEIEKVSNNNVQQEYYLTDLVHRAAEIQSIESIAISPKEALGINTLEQLGQLEKLF